MNLELIKKYEKEFLHMLHGGKVLMGKKDPITNTTKWYPSVLNPFVETSDTTVVVIDDEYCTYRKALADGKTIEYSTIANYKYPITRMDDLEVLIKANHSGKYIFRIKPDKHKFKVGDWVENITCTSPRIIKKVVNAPEGYDTVTVGNIDVGINVMLITDLELWKPREGEICIFWDNHSAGAFIDKFKYLSNNGKYHTERSCWDNCMPFTGVLPPHMKDNK